MHNSRFVLITKYCLGEETKKNEMVEACGMYGRQERFI